MSRTVEEYTAGHVEGALNIPYLVKCGPGKESTLRHASYNSRKKTGRFGPFLI